jgi:lipopolysaccharide biosynthesis protein
MFQPLATLAAKMNLKVRFDVDTPLAPLGTMYWFRPDALHKMFEWPWRWEEYNPEPRHIDGGLAHVQERLLCYVCIDRGYRILMAMTPQQAGRSYAKLEYKLQLLAARLASGNISIQRDQLDQLRVTTRSVLLRKLMEIYGSIVRRYPGARRTLRPMGQIVRRILHPKS